MAFIGLDVGTAGVKATVVELSGETITQAYREYDLRLPRPGWVEIRPDDVWAAARSVLSEAANRAGRRIEAIATASFGEASALLGADDRPVCDSIFYTDPRGTDELNELCGQIGRSEIEARTGMPVNHMYTLPKLMWLRKNRPALLDQVRKILPYASYIAYMFAGEAAADGSLASRTLLFNRHARDWDAELCEICGIDRSLLPRYAPAGTSVAPILPDVARSLGITEGAIVVSGVHDQVAAALGAGVFRSGDACDGIGSAECIIAPLPPKPDFSGMFAANICAEPYLGPGREVALAFTNAAGTALKWYRDTFERELAAACAGRGESAYAVLNEALSDSPSPLLFLPYLAGTGTPHMDALATGMLAGLTLSTTKVDIYRAIYEGTNFEIRMNLELLRRTGFQVQTLTAVGGGAVDAALRIKADILEAPIRTLKNSQSGTVGLAMLCGFALKEYATFEEAAGALVKPDKLIEPRGKHRAEYEEKYEQYLRMYTASRKIYGRG